MSFSNTIQQLLGHLYSGKGTHKWQRCARAGVDSGRSSTFPAGAVAGPGVDIFD